MKIEAEIPGTAPRPGPEYELVTDEYGSYWHKKSPAKARTSKLLVPLLWMAAVLCLLLAVVTSYESNADKAEIKTAERELKAAVRMSDSDIQIIQVFRGSDGIEVDYTVNGGATTCNAVPVLRPTKKIPLYHTLEVPAHGACTRAVEDPGIGNSPPKSGG